MVKHILKCIKCGRYTLKPVCCDKHTVSPKPAKFSPEDHYGDYRRKAKHDLLKSEGLI